MLICGHLAQAIIGTALAVALRETSKSVLTDQELSDGG